MVLLAWNADGDSAFSCLLFLLSGSLFCVGLMLGHWCLLSRFGGALRQLVIFIINCHIKRRRISLIQTGSVGVRELLDVPVGKAYQLELLMVFAL